MGMRTPLAARAVLTAASLLVGCAPSGSETDQSDTSDPRAITVESSADACEFSATDAPTGTLTFAVKNTGTAVTEFYLLGEDGLRVVAVVENIGPGIERALTVDAPAGGYVTVCKPGLAGEGIRGDFTVTGPDQVAADTDDGELVEQAETGYGAYVEDQSAQLLEKTRTFVGLYRAGKDDAARALYPVARTHWERIETVAESFGDLDPLMDAREADLA